jgi:hypothetical protein
MWQIHDKVHNVLLEASEEREREREREREESLET